MRRSDEKTHLPRAPRLGVESARSDCVFPGEELSRIWSWTGKVDEPGEESRVGLGYVPV